jgi:hypothetical protein
MLTGAAHGWNAVVRAKRVALKSAAAAVDVAGAHVAAAAPLRRTACEGLGVFCRKVDG